MFLHIPLLLLLMASVAAALNENIHAWMTSRIDVQTANRYVGLKIVKTENPLR